jgi:soluble lytic murein transglycosylase-like protein
MASTRTPAFSWRQITHVIASDIREGFVEITRHGMAAVGLAVIAVAITFAARPDMQTAANEFVLGWIYARQNDGAAPSTVAEAGASRSTAVATQALTPEQRSVTQWLSRKYRISPEPLAALVTEAWSVGERSQVPPTLILAVIAVESNFNPFAQRSDSHRGLMQIDSQTQQDTLSRFGGPLSVFDPLTNLRVGSRALQSFIQEAGSIEDGLRAYAQTSPQAADSTYTDRVLSEYKLLERLVEAQTTSATNPPRAASKRP